MSVLPENTTRIDAFTSLQQAVAAGGPSWVRKRREEGMAKFASLGFPSTKEERWKYTSVASIAKTDFDVAKDLDGSITPLDLADMTFQKDAAAELVFVNGHYSERLSVVRELPSGVRVGSLKSALGDPLVESHLGTHAASDGEPFVALNEALFEDGAFIHVPDGATVEAPIHLLFLGRPADRPVLASPRILVVAGRSARLTLVETWHGTGEGVYFNNIVAEVVAGDDTVIEHIRLQHESPSAIHLGSARVEVGRASSYASRVVTTGAALSRMDLSVELAGEGGDCVLEGLYLLEERQHADHETLIDHMMPHCTSRELYKGILDDRSRGIFEGKIIVRPDAQKTNARQTNNNLILSRDAIANTTPQLEIYADDVKCSHGSTIGRLDDGALFYLRSRGVDESTARDILTWGFASEIISAIRVAPVRERLRGALLGRLPAPGAGEVQ